MPLGTVLELSTSTLGGFCGRFFRVANWNVVKAEAVRTGPMEGPSVILDGQAASAVNCTSEYVDAGKQSIAIDPGSVLCKEVLARLINESSIVIWEPGSCFFANLDELVAAAPAHIVIVVPSHFGLRGPGAEWHGSDYTDWAAGGYTYITGYKGGPPRVGGGPWPAYAAGGLAAFTTLALVRATKNGRLRGQGPVVLDLSVQDAMVFLHQWTFSLFTHQGVVKERAGNRHAESYHPMGFLECSDGWICVGVATPEQWERFCLALDMPELILDARFESGGKRFDNADELDAALAPWLRGRTRNDAVGLLQENGVPASPVLAVREVLADPQLAAREFWQERAIGRRIGRMPGAPVRFRNVANPVADPAPAPGQDSYEVLRRLGYDGNMIQRYISRGVVGLPRQG